MNLRTRPFLLAAVLLAGVTFLPYWQTRGFEFVQYDDDKYVSDNAVVCQGLSNVSVGWAFQSIGYEATWHPLTWISLMSDVSLFGVNPGAMHLVNAWFHVAGAIVLLALLFRLTGSLQAALLAAAFWAAHPLRVESVAWVCQRKDVLSTFLGLLGLLCYLVALTPRQKTASADASVAEEPGHTGNRPCWYGLAIVLFVLAFLAKPTVVTFPFLAGLLEYAVMGRVRWRNLLGLAGVAVAGMLITIYTQNLGGAIAANVPFLERILNAISSGGIYLCQTLVPVRLAVPYLLGPPVAARVLTGLLAGGCLAGIFWYAGLSRRSRRCGAVGFDPVNTASLFPYAVGMAWFVVALGPMIGLLQLSFQAHADRFTSWPSVGLAIAMAWALCQIERKFPAWRRGMWLAAAGIVALLCVLTCRQVAHWRNTETLFAWTNRVTERNYVAHSNLGIYLFRHNRRTEGLAHLRLAVRYEPTATQLSDLAQALISENQLEEAEQLAIQLRDVHPQRASLGWFALGRIAWRRGQYQIAEQDYRMALQNDVENADLWNDLGNALLKQRRVSAAIAAWQQALALNPVLPAPRESLLRYAPAAAGE